MSYQYPFIPGHSSMSATPPTSYRWEGSDQQQQQQHQHQQDRLDQQVLQHPLQHQPEQHEDIYTSTPTVMQPQEQLPIVPSQNSRRPGSSHVAEGDESQLRLQHMSVPALLQPEHMRPLMIDTNRAYHIGTSASPPSGPPSAGPASAFHGGGIGPIRARISPVHTNPRGATHPYRRPQSAAGVSIARSRREPEDSSSVRRVPSSTSQGPLSASATAMTTVPSTLPTAVKMATTLKGLINPGYSATGNNVVIRTDLHFDSETGVLTAWCDLPGRSKADVSIVLSTNAMNRVKQVVVTAKAPQAIADDGCVLRERRSGGMSRTFVVPSGTTADDIVAEMHDGLLSLKIQCPPPLLEDDSQDIAIR